MLATIEDTQAVSLKHMPLAKTGAYIGGTWGLCKTV